MKTEREKVVFEQGPIFNVLPEEWTGTVDKNNATPNIANVRVWKLVNTVPVTITQFKGGAEARELSLLGDGFTTIAFNSDIKTNTGANKLLSSLKIYRFTYINDVWYEDA